MLNHIERNVESAVDYATKAYRNVKQAKEIQTSARKVRCCKHWFFQVVKYFVTILDTSEYKSWNEVCCTSVQ